ncbi:hypothetical protein ACIQIG_33045 [Streptomyces bacillaris]|uniref:hypothetical protein n=1 Tax=Streptomyces bacillaris TaxID=68179 RepID=UPI00346006A1
MVSAVCPYGRPRGQGQFGFGLPGSACSWPAPATREQYTKAGETYTGLVTDLVVEVLAGTGRHGTLTVVRAR